MTNLRENGAYFKCREHKKQSVLVWESLALGEDLDLTVTMKCDCGE